MNDKGNKRHNQKLDGSKRSHTVNSKNDPKVEEILKDKKYDPSTGQVQYPRTMGYHGTDNEQDLNPEE
jgi:hypothetical protein